MANNTLPVQTYRRIILLLVLILSLTGFTSCGQDIDVPVIKEVTHLERQDWATDVKQALNDFMDLYAFSPNAYVVFDFDNTCSIFDIEEQLEVHQLETMSFALEPLALKEAISSGVDLSSGDAGLWVDDITAAYADLYDRYGPFTPKGLDAQKQKAIQEDDMWKEFATKMLCMYDVVADIAGTDASYNWVLYWFTGMTETEVYDLARRSHEKYMSLPTSQVTWSGTDNVVSKLGPKSFTWTCGVQVTENIKELWSALKENGIDVWVCSASGKQQVLAAVDAFGLHPYCKGVMAMTIELEDGKYVSRYDDKKGCASLATSQGWAQGIRPTQSQTAGKGKVTAIGNVLIPQYQGQGPLAGFMDSTGDFNFCTEYKDLKLVVCFNRASRKVTDGGGLIAETAIYEREVLGYDLKGAIQADDILYVLQGRDENGMRTFRPSNMTLRYGESQEKLFANQDNQKQLEHITANKMSVKDVLDHFCIATSAQESELGFKYGFLNHYDGYRSK